MSLHAELSPEALERLRKQRRNSTISSILIAALSVVLVGLVLGIFLLPSIIQETPTIVTYESNVVEDTAEDVQKPQMKTDRKPAAPSSSIAKVIAANTSSPTSVPVPVVDVSTPSLDFGMEDDFGVGWGDSPGNDGGFANVPATMKKRCSESDRMSRLRQSGGTPAGEKAVKNALGWLKATQNENGSWGVEKDYPVAMTGLALLAYLGHCETPQSPEYGATVSKAITYLIDVSLKMDGKLVTNGKGHQWVYEHGIATYALAEAYTLCKSINKPIPKLDKVVKQAAEKIIEGQGESGGWVYNYAKGKSGDNSVGFWQIQALKACKHTGLFKDVQLKKTADKALEWLTKVQGADGSIGYRENSKQSPYLTGGGVLCFQLWEQGDSKQAKAGINYVSEKLKSVKTMKFGTPQFNLYHQYYNAQALINHGGKEWDNYNNLFRDELIQTQDKDGSWPHKTMTHGPNCQIMTTCLATLMLEVYYRFLPGTGSK